MTAAISLLSVRRGGSQSLFVGDRVLESGIRKQPVDSATIGSHGVVGDTVADTRNHGGADQAVYVYSLEDYAWWEEHLQRALPVGIFGENLTFSAFGVGDVMIGDRWRIGEVVLETTAPRIPCGKLGAVMKDPRFAEVFRRGRRPGFYARVLATGVVAPGMEVTRLPGRSGVTLLDLFDLVYNVDAPADELRRVLAAPIAERARRNTEQRLERLTRSEAN